jgi:transcriptional regulator
MSVKKRLKDFIKSQGLTISGFEKDINVSNGYVNSISKGIGGEVLLSILEKSPKLNIDWLLTGKGSMLKEDTSKPVNTPEDMGQVALLQQENSFLKEKITLLEENKILQAKEIKRLEEEIKRIKK